MRFVLFELFEDIVLFPFVEVIVSFPYTTNIQQLSTQVNSYFNCFAHSVLNNVLNLLPTVEEAIDAVFLKEIESGLQEGDDSE